MISGTFSFCEGTPGDGRRFRTLFHPEHYGAHCPRCGGRARWPAILGNPRDYATKCAPLPHPSEDYQWWLRWRAWVLKSNFSAIAAARVQTLLGRAFRPQEVHAIVATAIREAIRYAESRCGEESPECQIGVYHNHQLDEVQIRYRRPQ